MRNVLERSRAGYRALEIGRVRQIRRLPLESGGRRSAETGKLPFGRYRSLESDGLQGAGRIGNALFLRSVAVATPLAQNVMERSWARNLSYGQLRLHNVV